MSQVLIASQYDCNRMDDNRTYSLIKAAECKISPEKLYIAAATITLYQKKLIAPTCQQQYVLLKVHVFRYKCGMFSQTSYVHDQDSITYDMIVTPKLCRLASKSKKNQIYII